MCSSNVSDTANRLLKRTDSEGSSSVAEKKSSAVPLISKRSHIGNMRQIRKQGKGRSSKRKGNRRCPFLFAPAAGRGTFPPSADGESPAEVQRKTLRPERANPPAAVRAPRLSGAEKEPPRQGEHAYAVRAPRWVSAEKISRKFSKKLTIHGQFSPPSGIGLKEVTQ